VVIVSVSKAGFQWDIIPMKSQPSNPAAGVDFTYTVPTGKRGKLMLWSGKLTTSADAANRSARFSITVASQVAFIHPVAAGFANQTASAENYYTLGIGVVASDGADQEYRAGPLPKELELPAGSIIATTTTNIDNTDQWAIRWIYKEVVE
jgi:hypothetical protein